MDTFVATILVIFWLIRDGLVSVPTETNLALRKPAFQSSTSYGFLGMASNAVDGTSDGNFYEGSCTHTSERAGVHWWMVDLLKVYTFRSLRISNRNDCCFYFLNFFSIEVSTEHPSTLPGFPGRTTAHVCITETKWVSLIPRFPFECDTPQTGRFVRVIMNRDEPDARLTICEFELYENKIIARYPVPERPNLALMKPASQCSTFKDFIAAKAVDGSTLGFLHENSCTHTFDCDPSWWMVDLENNFKIDQIRITNRLDCCALRLANFVIEVSEKHPSTLEGFPNRTNAPVCITVQEPVPIPVPVAYECEEALTGRYVRLVQNEYDINLCEIEVYGMKSLVGTESPRQLEENRNGPFVYVHVKSNGLQGVSLSTSKRNYLAKCALQRLKLKENMMAAPYIHIDLRDGTCRFLRSMAENLNSRDSKWAVYKLVTR